MDLTDGRLWVGTMALSGTETIRNHKRMLRLAFTLVEAKVSGLMAVGATDHGY